MRKIFSTVQQRIGLLISVVGIIAVIDNIIERYIAGGTIIFVISGITVWLLFITILPFIISIFIENKILKIVQILLLIFTGIVNIMDAFNQIYGPGMFLAAWLLMRHYGFMDNYRKIKYILFLFFLIMLSQISAIIHDEGAFFAGMEILQYALFIVTFVIIIWNDILNEQKKLRVDNKSLTINYKRIRDQLIEIEEEQKPYNLKEAKISPAEERVVKTLTIYKASNREIAERLNIAESTVKLHLYNIYNKIGVDNRFAIIDLCKYNYT